MFLILLPDDFVFHLASDKFTFPLTSDKLELYEEFLHQFLNKEYIIVSLIGVKN